MYEWFMRDDGNDIDMIGCKPYCIDDGASEVFIIRLAKSGLGSVDVGTILIYRANLMHQ